MLKSIKRHNPAQRRKSKRYWRKVKTPFKLSPRTKWRALIRKVINNLSWISDQPAKKTIGVAEKKDETEVVTQYDKFLLFKDPQDRKEEDLLALAKRLSSYKTFRKYSLNLRISLLKRARYYAFRQSTAVIRQGVFMNHVYVLIKGNSYGVHETMVDGQSEKDVNYFREGYMVGEYPLLYEKPSMISIMTEGPTEWMVFNKHHFVMFSREELKKQYYEIENGLRKFNFFDKLTMFEKREYCIISEVIHIAANTVLPMFEGTVGQTYFVLEGRCSVLQKVMMVKDRSLRYPSYRLHRDQETNDPKAEAFIIRTCIITRRGVFGLGEEACRWVIVTDTESSFMVIPRYMLLKYCRNMVWERLKDQLDSAYPSLESIIKSFNERKRWRRFSYQTSQQLAKIGLSGNNIHNVPFMSRCIDPVSEDEVDQVMNKIKASKEKLTYTNLKSYAKKFELCPNLKKLIEFIPKDEMI